MQHHAQISSDLQAFFMFVARDLLSGHLGIPSRRRLAAASSA
jgi:hypothetical protein